MNNIQELIERIKTERASVNGGLHPLDAEIITALESMQAPLPEDAARAVRHLRATANDLGIKLYAEYADMLERLARENASVHQANRQCTELNQRQEQRIKRLDAALAKIAEAGNNHGIKGPIYTAEYCIKIARKARAGSD
jgi:gamma-glutamyl:cysteine ligase YbdK (ATP-grasp superfamily)